MRYGPPRCSKQASYARCCAKTMPRRTAPWRLRSAACRWSSWAAVYGSSSLTTPLDVEPTPRLAQAILGAAREALNNVVKHSGASRAVLRVLSRDDGLQITVRDQGRGYEPGTMAGGFGLAHSVLERLREVGGRADVWSEPGRGTRVRLWVPN
jgi:signal transduction histidine kinase